MRGFFCFKSFWIAKIFKKVILTVPETLQQLLII